ncbi:MAG: PQQ-dependent sugar dehydrogenase [Chloroflexi bacterium]|nr:MAG: PQQ-dependent sugar dehydrogenase [Chloroflexota bacterium]
MRHEFVPAGRLMKPTFLPLIFLLLSVAAFACGGGDGGGEESLPFGLQTQTVTTGDHVSAMAFAPDGRLFFAEKFTGNIRIVGADGKALSDPFAHLDVADWLHLDWGLTGLALDPNFASNHFVYAFYSQPVESPKDLPIARPVLVRFTEQNNKGIDQTVVIDDFPQSRSGHQGFKTNGRIHFGSDGALYLDMGDYDWGKTGPNGTGAAQDLSLPLGKFLRVDTSGKPLPDNPYVATPGSDPRIFAIGFSRGFDFAFHPQSKKLYSTDNTDSCEELDIVQAGGNYGWPKRPGKADRAAGAPGQRPRPVPVVYQRHRHGIRGRREVPADGRGPPDLR